MEGKKACGISIHARNPRICYACYSTGDFQGRSACCRFQGHLAHGTIYGLLWGSWV